MSMIRSNEDNCRKNLEILEDANTQWFYGYNYETADYLNLVKAVEFFQNIKVEMRKKLIKEGKL